MANATQIIDRAYTLSGIKASGEPLSPEDAQYALDALNAMLDSWNTQGYFSPTVNEIVTTVSGLPVTIGPAMMINVDRPVTVLGGSFIRINNVDYPIEWVTREQYNEISVKNVAAPFASIGFYDQNFPTGNIYFWPYPPSGAELHLQLPFQLEVFSDLSTDYVLIPGYLKAMQYSLAEELAIGVRQIDPAIARQAMIARKAIRRTNVSVPVMSLTSSAGSPYAQFISGT